MPEESVLPVVNVEQKIVFFCFTFENQQHTAGISFDALGNHFGAGLDAKSLADAYLAHRTRIDKSATRLIAAGVMEPLVLTSKMF